jgi:hypothetical protein
VFGCDFLVTAAPELRVVLLEVNDKVGFRSASRGPDRRYDQFTKNYYQWVYANAIQPMIQALREKARLHDTVADDDDEPPKTKVM